ncbi:MAG: hypothetical protein HUU16_17750 [Candidatus Omnitrophica bacterium]|nr:hypothetical protein [bacterium]NUN98011.1 hypothetical protein [Candidatus Omnitrophota bacterium]
MPEKKARGSWGIRFLIHLLTLALGILAFWLLSFLLEDIESVEGPDYQEIERRFVDRSAVERMEELGKLIDNLEREIGNKREEQRLLADSSENLQRTINQILELQRLSVEKQVTLPESESQNLSASLEHFLKSQKDYQGVNEALTELTSRKVSLDQERRDLEERIAQQRKPAEEEFRKLLEAHRLKLAFLQLLILIPLLIVAAYLLLSRRGGVYFPIFAALAGATLLKVVFVVHEYFPSRYFKYIFTLALLAVVARLLVYFIRMLTFPKREVLLRQYREAYERFLCPACEYPIRTGPRRFLYWTRRTVHKSLPHSDLEPKEEAYTCPACGTALYEECSACHGIRHSLLVYCEHCGATKEVEGGSG